MTLVDVFIAGLSAYIGLGVFRGICRWLLEDPKVD